MELIQEFLASPYEAGGLVLDWPSVPPRTCVFVPLLVRDGGVLGAVPFGFLDASLVSAGQTGALDAVVGPSSEVELALAEEEEDGSLRPVEEVCKALLVDFSLEVASFVACYDPVTSPVEAVPFVPARPDQQIAFSEALATARAWIAAEEGERLAFYSAAEGADVPAQGPIGLGEPKKRPAPKAKRHTNAQLAEQIGTLVDLIPALTQQMQDLSARQAALEKKAAAPSPPAPSPLPVHRQPFPLTGSLVPPPNPLGALNGLIGALPRCDIPCRALLLPCRRRLPTKSLVWTKRPESPFCPKAKVCLQRQCCSRAVH